MSVSSQSMSSLVDQGRLRVAKIIPRQVDGTIGKKFARRWRLYFVTREGIKRQSLLKADEYISES
jgi:hypothetical protein